MGLLDEIPDEDVYEKADIQHMEPGRVASVLENYFYNPRSITRATRDFIPKPEDVIVASNPSTGDKMVLRLVKILNSLNDEAEFAHVVADPNYSLPPWIESRFVDGNPLILTADQPGYHRIFKTHMASQGLNVSKKNAPLYVTTARHPVDVRVSWYHYVKRCYDFDNKERPIGFAQRYKLDDFVSCSATTAQINPLAKSMTLEHIMLDWYAESQNNRRVFVVFYEQLLTDAHSVVVELATFLKIPPSALTPKLDQIVALVQRECPQWDEYTSSSNGELFSYESSLKIHEAWKRALESSMTTKDGKNNKSYEDFYALATGREFPFPKQYAKKPLGKGPLDKVGQKLEKKCVVS